MGEINTVLLAVRQCQGEKKRKAVDIRRDEDNVICLANGSNLDVTNGNTKWRILCNSQLFIVVNFVEFATLNPSLFNTLFIINWCKQLFVPFNYSFTVSKSLIDV